DEVVDVYLSVHVPVHDLGHVGTATRAAERRTLPHAPRHPLKRPRLDLLSGTGDPDDPRHAPAAMTAFERLAHEFDVTDTLEAVISAAVGERAQVRHEIPRPLLRVHEVRHAEARGERLAARVEVDTDDAIRACQARPLDDVQPNAAQAKHHHVRARFDLCGVDHRADTRGHAAADVTDL